MSHIEVKVPDIGDFNDVPVIEVHVKVGDVVKAEDALITLESDKATMDVPAPAAGTVKEVKVKLGDKVNEGTLILLLEASAAVAAPVPAPNAVPAPTAEPVPVAADTCRLARGDFCGPSRHRNRHARARRRSRRLFGRLPQRRPRHEDRAGRALCDAGRRLPERRLYSFEGAAACRGGDRGSRSTSALPA